MKLFLFKFNLNFEITSFQNNKMSLSESEVYEIVNDLVNQTLKMAINEDKSTNYLDVEVSEEFVFPLINEESSFMNIGEAKLSKSSIFDSND